jgi:hypothetical protein
MKAKKMIAGLFVASFVSVGYVCSQETEKASVDLSASLVSSYVWRGFKQAGASLQPALGVTYKGVSLAAWGSADIAGNDRKEVDFSAGYAVAGVSLALTDYWWDGESVNRYFSRPAPGNMGHLLEAGVQYTLPGAFPLSLAWNTFLLGEGNRKADGSNSFSTYVEVSYPFTFKEVDFTLSAGFLPWESAVYGLAGNGLAVASIQLGASRELKISERFSLPVFAQVIANPTVEDIHFVFGVTIK